MHAAGHFYAMPGGGFNVERRRIVSQIIRVILRKETDLTEIVSGLGAVLWAAFSAHADVASYAAVPGIALLPPSALVISLQSILAMGGGLQLVAVFSELHRLRRFCALSAAGTWGAIGALAFLSEPHAQSALPFAVAAACALAFVKMGRPAPRDRA